VADDHAKGRNRYRTGLPALLASALETGVNHVLALDENSVERLERLEGKVLRLDLEGLAITLYFSFAFGAVEVDLESEAEPDARVSGSPPALFALAAPEDVAARGDWGAPGSGVRIEGDATLARDLAKIFSLLDPDWRAPVNGLLGDVLGHQVTEGIKRGAEGLRDTLRSALNMTGRFLNEESGALAKQSSVDDFTGGVDDLRDGIDRLEARLARAERRRQDTQEQ